MDSLKPRKLTREQKKEALAYLMYLKKKSKGRIKGRGCADGRKQRQYVPKADATSPTVSTEVVFVSAVIDAHEGRDIAVIDIPGAYLHANMDDAVFVKFQGKMVELLVKIDPKIYRPYVEIDKYGKKVLYAQLHKALYGCLKSGLLFWKNLTIYLRKMGFALNSYDNCLANKTIYAKQCTII